MAIIDVIIPAMNEEKSIAKVVNDIPAGFVREIIVVDNNSTDKTASRAEKSGSTVLTEENQGYGYACLKGINYINSKKIRPDIIVFLDGDYSDHPEEMEKLVGPIVTGNFDMVIGSRALGKREKKSMMPAQVFGNWLSVSLIKMIYGMKFSDLGPFRAIRLEALNQLKMRDKTYGWTVEMQVKAAKMKLRCTEVPVTYRKRIGKSKVSGTVKGTILAGAKIIYTIIKYSM